MLNVSRIWSKQTIYPIDDHFEFKREKGIYIIEQLP